MNSALKANSQRADCYLMATFADLFWGVIIKPRRALLLGPVFKTHPRLIISQDRIEKLLLEVAIFRRPTISI